MKRLILITMLLFLMLLPISLLASAFSDTVTVELQVFIPDNGMLYLNDLDISNLSQAPVLFGITIHNYFSEPIEITMRFGIQRNGEDLVHATTYPFPLSPGDTYITNQDLETNYPLADSHIELGDLEDIVLTTGKLPVGEYVFFVEIEYQQQNIDAYDEEVLTIAEPPTVLDLLSPGQPAESANLTEIYTTLPIFIWHSNADSFRITICEKLPINSSPADAMNNEPYLQATIQGLTFFPYPSAGVRALQPGKTYFWQIIAITETSGGPVELESEIWGFRVNNMGSGFFSMEHQQVMAYLTSFFGGKGLSDLFEPGGELDGYTFTGVMFKNGNPMTMEDLNAIIEAIVSSHIKIDSYQVE